MAPKFKETDRAEPGHPVTVSQPLEFLRATTYRQREVCQVLTNVVDGSAQSDDIIKACQFLSVELFLHFSDEADDVVPLLRARCKPDDNIELVIHDFSREHKLIKALSLKVSKALMAQVASTTSTRPRRKAGKVLREQSTELVEGLRRLAAIENGIILPIARARFKPEDLEDLSLSMAMRRGWAT